MDKDEEKVLLDIIGEMSRKLSTVVLLKGNAWIYKFIVGPVLILNHPRVLLVLHHFDQFLLESMVQHISLLHQKHPLKFHLLTCLVCLYEKISR
jgi:hypothetical protein